MTDSEKIEFLGGQVHALIGFATAIIIAELLNGRSLAEISRLRW